MMVKKKKEKNPKTVDWENFSLPDEIKRQEAEYIEMALLETEGRVTKAAKMLGISHQHLSLLLKSRHKELAHAKKARRRRSDFKKKKS